jgi:hypothetical protein
MTHGENTHKYIILVVVVWTMGHQNPPVDNPNDFFMHFLAMSRNGQVAIDGSNG